MMFAFPSKKAVRFRLILLAAFLPFFCVAPSYGAQPDSTAEQKEAHQINMNIDDWRPWCFGRFVVMLPQEAQVGVGDPRYDFSDITTTPMEPEAFQAMLQQRHKELQAIKHNEAPSYLLDASVMQGIPLSGIFIYYKGRYGQELVSVEAYRLQNGLSYKLVTDASPDRIQVAKNIVTNEMRNMSYRGDHEIPTVPGFCFRNGFIADDGKMHDNFSISVKFPGHPDAMLNFEMYTNGKDNLRQPLLDIASGAFSSLGNLVSGVHVMRKGNRKLGDDPGQELLTKGPQEGGYVGHVFRWEAVGLPGDPLHPQIGIEFSTANRFQAYEGQPASFTDDEALKLWDQILSTFKLRPVTEPQKTSQIPAPRFNVKIGTKLVNTKQPCPQTGYWISAVDGERLLLRAGEAMPPAKVYKPQTRLEKLTGKTPDFEYMETVWTLAAYADNGGRIIEGDS